jgi:predicted glycogen debranching enzyme
VQRTGGAERGAAPGAAGESTRILQRGADGVTVIAGYPWFSDWGRDTMIALPGLTLATGRSAQAASILRTFTAHLDRGMLPNRFPDAQSAPEYNTADATLWYFHALGAYLDATGDLRLLAELYPRLREIIHWHRQGTRYGIHVDGTDGLLRIGEPGVQLTWMDARIGDWVVTPRTGKPVEINALWHLSLEHMARWAQMLGDAAATDDYGESAARVQAAFATAFWYEAGGYLYDVIDCEDDAHSVGPAHVDTSLRPNQILAVSLSGALLDARRARSVVDVCARELLTPVGLRSLAPSDPRYAGRYGGNPRARDAAYHQGTVWSWLLGPFALAHYRVHGDAAHALGILAGLAAHLDEGCMGTISEIFDGDAPHAPRGCFAQAWSVGETLRAWHVLSRARPLPEIPLSLAGAEA